MLSTNGGIWKETHKRRDTALQNLASVQTAAVLLAAIGTYSAAMASGRCDARIRSRYQLTNWITPSSWLAE